MKKIYQLTLSDEQLSYLTNGDSMDTRFGKFAHLVREAKIVDTDFSAKVKKAVNFRIPTGHVGIPMTQLAQTWDCDRKTAIAFVKSLERLGLATISADHQTTLVNLHCIAGWSDGEKVITNPNYIPLKDRIKHEEAITSNVVETTETNSAEAQTDVATPESSPTSKPPQESNSNDVEQSGIKADTTTSKSADIQEPDYFDEYEDIPEPPADLFHEDYSESATNDFEAHSDSDSPSDIHSTTKDGQSVSEGFILSDSEVGKPTTDGAAPDSNLKDSISNDGSCGK
jgi:hypothetical protein